MATTHGPRPTRRTRPAGLVALVLAAGVLQACSSAPAPAPVVAIYGDSLVNSSGAYLEDSLRAAAPGHQVLNRNKWGSAVCDWLDQMRVDARQDVDIVVLAFFGNMGTPCTGESTLTERYTADATTAVRLWQSSGARVVLAASPASTGTLRDAAELRAAFQAVADAHQGVRFVDVGAGFVDTATGRYESVLPCRDGEPCQSGFAVVRSPDTIHLCDHGDLNSLLCPPQAAGVRRFVAPIAEAVAAEREQLVVSSRPASTGAPTSAPGPAASDTGSGAS